jgi:hypothetical protein
MTRNSFAALIILFSSLGIAACGGGKATKQNPLPSISSVSPANAFAGSAGFSLVINGSGFIAGSKVRWNGFDRTTTFVGSTQLQALIAVSDVVAAGTAQVQVFNPTPGGGVSSAVTFPINNPAPELSTLIPSGQSPGGAAFTLTLSGSHFLLSSVVRWNGSNRATTFVSSTQLSAVITAADIASAGTAQVVVFNPGPGGGVSNSIIFSISNRIPAISLIRPSSRMVGGSGFTLTVTGMNFSSLSVVRWNGSNRATTFVSSTELAAAIPAGDIASTGTAGVTVVNPATDGGASAAAAFTIAANYPIVEDLGPILQNASVRGRDGLFSALIDGKSYWSFGDTSLASPNAAGKNFFSNSLAWTDSLDASHGIYLNHDYTDSTGAVTQFLPLTADEQQFNADHQCPPATGSTCGEEYAVWNGPIVPVPNSDNIYYFYGAVLRGGDISWFNVVGVGIAVWNKTTMEITRPDEAPGTPNPTLMWQGNSTFGDGALLDGSYVYALGCLTNWLLKDCRVGRAPIDSVTTPSAWQYYTGNNASGTDQWSADQNMAVTVFNGGAAGNSIFYNAAMQKYMVVYSGVFVSDIYYRTADHIWGPWSDQTKLFTGLPNNYDTTADYAAMAHPEFAEQNGNVQYIAYVHITGFLANDIRLVRVTLQEPAP